MLTIEWTSAKGWSPGRIIPYQNLSLDPATCVFHYAFECFEGMKAYKVCAQLVCAHYKGQRRQDPIVPTRQEYETLQFFGRQDRIACMWKTVPS
jgi:hypothetical protein